MLKALLGIIVAIALILVAATFVGVSIFNKYVEKQLGLLAADVPQEPPFVFTYEGLEELPRPVERYFKFALRSGEEEIRLARLRQTGLYKAQEASDWSYLEAEQYFFAVNPAFIWIAKMNAAPLMRIAVMDEYYEGKGTITVKFLSALTIRNTTGKEVNISEMLRYFSEAPWFPTALLPSDFVRWEELGETKAQATFSLHGLSASAIFTFDEQGGISSFETRDCYRESGGRYYKEDWIVHYKDYKDVGGIRIPMKIEKEWNVENQAFKYASLTVTDVEYDVAERYKKERQ